MSGLTWRLVLSCGHELATAEHLTGTMLCPVDYALTSVIMTWNPAAVAAAEKTPQWQEAAHVTIRYPDDRKDPPDE